MATLDEKVDKLEEKYFNLHTVVNVLATKVDSLVDEMKDFKQEMREFKQEMRDKDNQRQAEIVEVRNSIKEIYQTTDIKIAKIASKLDAVTNHIQILTVTALAGIVAIAVAVFLK